jgi:hypothetical protein
MPNPTDIFGNLTWLNKWVKNLLGRVYTLEQGGGGGGGGTVSPDGITITGSGAVINPLTSVAGGYLDENNNLVGINNSNNTVSVAHGGTHLIPDFSGMLIVNDHYDGRVELWIAGSGDTVLVSYTRILAGVPTNTLEISGNGYSWKNNDNLTGPFTFTVIKTRPGS